MRYLLALFAALAVVAILGGNPVARRLVFVILAILVVYAALKLGGVLESPARMG